MSRAPSDDIEKRRDEPDDNTTLLPSAAGSVTAWAPGLGDSATTTDDPALAEQTGRGASEEGSWVDEGLITLLIVAGTVLFVVPEPATSAVGILLLIVGVIAWIADAAT